MSDDTVQVLLKAIEQHGNKKVTIGEWIGIVTLCITIMGIGVNVVKSPIVDDLNEQKGIVKETVDTLHEVQMDIVRQFK